MIKFVKGLEFCKGCYLYIHSEINSDSISDFADKEIYYEQIKKIYGAESE